MAVAILTQELFWQKVPSAQGVEERAQGAFIPLHSFALQDDISVEGITGAINPSVQYPPLHFCPTGQELLAKQGSLADPPLMEGRRDFDEPCFIRTKAIKLTTIHNPNPVSTFRPIASDDG